jgi:5'-phosphate synthase pdxT subunit
VHPSRPATVGSRNSSFRGEDPSRHVGASRRLDGRVETVHPSRPATGSDPSRHGGGRIAVLALQGAFRVHVQRLGDLGVDAVEARVPRDLIGVDGLVMPGGESTTMSNLLASSGLFDEIKARVCDGLPVFGTCAGMILLATEVLDGRADQRSFGVLDATVRRNGYGRQRDSFETDLDVVGLDAPFHGVFIRAPRVESVGPAVEVLAGHQDDAVLLRQGRVMAAAFHPELTNDGRLHAAFVELVRSTIQEQ